MCFVNKMTPEEIELFNHNVEVENNNTKYMENITGILSERIDCILNYLDETSFVESLMIFSLVLLLIINFVFVQQLENRVTELEEKRPEKEPLLSNF